MNKKILYLIFRCRITYPLKNLLPIIVSLFLLSTGCRTQKHGVIDRQLPERIPVGEQQTDFSEQSTWLLGYFNRERLSLQPHSEWYVREYERYKANQEALDNLSKISRSGITIKIVLGTWCPDSRREVPRFLRIIDLWEFPSEAIMFIGVDDIKISPVGEYYELGIERVPTFIIYKNNIEAGRIIENPLTSLEQDMTDILKGNE